MSRPKATEASTDVVKRIRARARTEGIEAGYEAALAVCRNEKARSADRLDAANLMCRIGGIFEGAGEDDGTEKPLSTMTRAELVNAANRARADLAELDEPASEGRPDVFD